MQNSPSSYEVGVLEDEFALNGFIINKPMKLWKKKESEKCHTKNLIRLPSYFGLLKEKYQKFFDVG